MSAATFRASNRTPEFEAKRVAGLRAALCGKKKSMEHRIKIGASRRGKECTHPRMVKGPNHRRALKGWLRCPNGRALFFQNLTHFVRTNPVLFAPEDVEWRRTRYGRPGRVGNEWCRAARGLQRMFLLRRATASWKGWTRIPECEIEGKL